ncbi:MAG: heavy metal translocating P-type ATPase, partial [Candidatus Aminicenantes bacterium]|nr:heavy metal translocating P-type ATPase [Candidatus Aminicenantes bacterium]
MHGNHDHSSPAPKRGEAEQTYTCPMHPEIRQAGPGRCPLCGMALVPVKAGQVVRPKHEKEYDKHAGHKMSSFLAKFWVALALTIPILVYSELPEKLLGFKAPAFPGSGYLALVLGSAIYFYCGWVFLAGAWRELRARLPGMMTLIALAITAAYSFSVFVTLTGGGHTLFWELGTLITVMLLGHWIEMRAVQGTQGALRDLAKLLPDQAEVIRGGKTEIVPLAELKERDVVLVKPGGKVPADGRIVEGRSELNESIITGESKPVPKTAGDEVIAGSMNGDGALKIEVTKIGEATFLAGVMRLVAEAQASKSRLQILSDKAAFYLTVVAVVAGGITFSAWLLSRAGLAVATERLVAVLVIACPHALGLAIPLVASISTAIAARNGLLVRQRLALEAARKVSVVLFDKTGTLTKGAFGVDSVVPNANYTRERVLQMAASVNSASEHPLAKAMVEEARREGLSLLAVKDFERLPGKGAKAEVEGHEVRVGNDALLNEAGASIPLEHQPQIAQLSGQGKTVIHVMTEGKLVGSIALADVIREESREAIRSLKRLGVKVAMITGDSEDVASWVSRELELDEYFARVLPQEKVEKVRALQRKGLKVAMVGDGINDAPALTQADLGIAIGAGTNVALESAGIILVKSDPRDIPKVIRLSQLTYTKMMQNLFWASGYNLVALPIAAGALASKGIIL